MYIMDYMVCYRAVVVCDGILQGLRQSRFRVDFCTYRALDVEGGEQERGGGRDLFV